MANPKTSRDQPGITARQLVGQYWNSVSIYDGPDTFRREFQALPDAAQHLFAVFSSDSEVCNGGFHQFFSNSTGVLAPEAVEGFRAVGLEECAKIVQAAIARFGEPYQRDRAARREALKRIGAKFFDDLDDRYYAAKDRTKFLERLDEHASRHAR